MTFVQLFWKPSNSTRFIIAGQSLWLAITSYACSFLGRFQVPAFLLIMLYVGVAIIYHLNNSKDASSVGEKFKRLLNKTDFELAISHLRPIKSSMVHSDVEDVSLSDTMDSIDTFEGYIPNDASTVCNHATSSVYFKCLFYACLVTFLYRNTWVIALAAIPTLLHLIRSLSQYSGFTDFICNQINDIYLQVKVICCSI